MPVEVNIVESETALNTTVVEVNLVSASEPGPPGPPGADGAPDTADYLVGTANAGLSAEIVVGTTPGGELGGTWASPTVDATHSGSSHASIQAAAEATAAGELATHAADTTGVHGIADTSALALTASHPTNATFEDHSARHEDGGADEISLTGLSGIPAALTTHEADTTLVHGIADTSLLAVTSAHPTNATFNDHSARHENGGADEISLAGLDGTPTELTNHLSDSSAAHAASAISADSTTLVGTGTDVQAVLEELDNSVADHLADATDAHDASAISVVDAGGYFAGADVETAFQEVGAKFDEMAYVEITADVTVSATAEGTPTDVMSAGAVVFDGSTRVCIEVCLARVECGATAGSFTFLNLWDGDATNLGRLGAVSPANAVAPFSQKRFLTPSAASHTYKVKGWRVNSNGVVRAGSGGTDELPGFIRITRAP